MKSLCGACWSKGLIIIPGVVCLFVLMNTHSILAQDIRANTSGRSFVSPSTSLSYGDRYILSTSRYGGVDYARSSIMGEGVYRRQGISGLPKGFAGSRIGGRPGIDDLDVSKYSPNVNKSILAQMYNDSFTGSYRNWYQPEALVESQAPIAIRRESNSTTQGAKNTTKTLSLEQLVNNYIISHRQNYLQLGWEKFKRGEYRAACDTFLVADSVSYDTPKDRSLVKLAVLQSAVASRQYMLAISSLKWLLTPDTRTEQLPNPDFLNLIKNIRTKYGIQSDFDEHVLLLNTYARNNLKLIELMALRSVVLWSRGDRNDALYYAGELNRIVQSLLSPQRMVWMQLYPLMMQADRADRLSERMDEQKSDSTSQLPVSVPLDLPFELPGE